MSGIHKKIVEGVVLVGGMELSDSSDCLVYAVDVGDLVLIDCGAGSSWPQIKKNLQSAGLAPKNIHTLILTHAHVDHIGAAAQIRRETNCQIVAHNLDASAIRSGDGKFTVADLYGVKLEGVEPTVLMAGDTLPLTFSRGDLRLLHTPGHTPGSIVVTTEIGGKRVLFGQDVHGPFSPAFGSDIQAWRTSMQKLLALRADILCEGHFGTLRPASTVSRFIQDQLDQKKFTIPMSLPF